MRIGIDIRPIGRKRTGDETYTRGLVKGLLSIDRENEYFLYTNTNDQDELEAIKRELGEQTKQPNAQVVPVLPASKSLWTFYALPKRAKQDGLDILHVQYITPVWLSKKISLVTTIHDVSFKRYPEYIRTSDLLLLNIFIPISLRKANAVIGVSKFTRDEILQCYELDQKKVKAILNGHQDPSKGKIVFSEQEKTEFRAGRQLHRPYLFYLGTLQPRKNVPFLIKGFEYLKKHYGKDPKIGNLELVVGGSFKGRNVDPEIKQCREAIEDESIRKSVRFVGYIEERDVPLYYRCAEAYVNASFYEGFGLPIVESMAQQTPVVCCSDSSYPEIAGGAAMMFKNNDMRDFADKIRKLLGSEEVRRECIDKGRENAKRFDWHKCAMQTMELYATILNNKA